MTVFRIHTRPKGGLGNAKVSFAYCINAGVLGLGWQTNSQDSNATWSEYKNEAKKIYGEKELSRVKYLKKNVLKDDLIWARDTDGCYYLGKVDSEWEYLSNKHAQDADIVNVVRCGINKIPSIDDVPGKVIACFRPSRTIQAIRDNTAIQYSKYLWNKISNTEYYELPKEHFKNVFSFLDSEETEDVIFIYLQLQGWVVIPNSRKADTMSYEFYLIHRESNERAIVQVKTGHTVLRLSEWDGNNEKVFLFQSNNKYLGTTESSNVITISPSEIETFMYGNKPLLPSNIVHWLELADSEKKI